ncbi:MAG TPA: hypothetical protein VFW45_03485, partial [Candidatus Polarisedimenticolia bacterium]|nr:hypothetical protein [Candidatus Polarisedimenticolia bacterium]
CQLSTGDNLHGFVEDCHHFLAAQQPSLRSVTISTMEDAQSMVNGLVTIGPAVSSLQDISKAIVKAWAEIAYLDFQATSLRWYEEATVFKFITGVPITGLGVAGTFIALGPQYPQLVEKFRSEFSETGAKVKRIPGGLPPWAAQHPF